MREVRRSALVSQPQSRMYALITDVESYPSFLPWCTHLNVESRSDSEIIATLGLKRGPLHTEITTRTLLEPERRIDVELIRGPFRLFRGEWELTPINSAGTRVEFTLRFAFSSRVTAALFEPLFEDTATSLVDAFVTRARSLA